MCEVYADGIFRNPHTTEGSASSLLCAPVRHSEAASVWYCDDREEKGFTWGSRMGQEKY